MEKSWRENHQYQYSDQSEQRDHRSGYHDQSYQQPPFHQYPGNPYYSSDGASSNPEMFNAARFYGSMNSHSSVYPGYMMSPPRQNPVTILQRNQNRRYQSYGRQHGPGGDN